LFALDINDDTFRITLQGMRADLGYVISRAGSSPHLAVLQQVRINEHTQLSAVTKRRHTKSGFMTSSPGLT
jgi:ABC-type proline/glycine betaine transport system ATPase subunit